ncbi:SEC-C domain-containing protein [Prescottella subtropica]|uniref:SEC-C domain-containing protein n=1 Tax=Prescottella subtropica TaxID=2545757 RepID=UPI0010F4B575|nr:SEC-C domain-containing protein [Prescottella subtropica]
MNETSDSRDLPAAALDVLRASGPLTAEDWAERLADAGLGAVAEMTELVEMLDHPLGAFLSDGRHAALDTLLEGRVFTHRLAAAEVASGLLYAEPDLAPLVMLVMADDDGPVEALFADYDADELEDLGLADEDFPDGSGLLFGGEALEGFSAGDLVAVTVGDGGVLTLSRVDGEVASTDLTAALDRIVGADNTDNLETVVWQLLADDPGLCAAPTLPLGELIEAAGYDRAGDYIASHGFDFDAHHLGEHIAMVAREHDLHRDEVDAVVAFVQFVAAAHDDELGLAAARDRAGELAGPLAGLEDPAAAAAALDVVNAVEGDYTPALYTAALAVADRGPRRARASGHWLAGMAADTLGDVLEAEKQFSEAAAMDEAWMPALFELAHIASDRGDAQRGLSLLSRIDGGETERLHEVLTRFAPAEHPELGRNDKCWCGSGRKYKVCHLGKSDSTLDDRADWLYEKATLYAQSTVLFDQVYGLAQRLAGVWDDDTAVAEAYEEPIVMDTALFEGGLFTLFVARRGALLPADEFDLAGRWLQTRRSLHEVTAVDGAAVTLRNLGTGESADVEHDGDWYVGDLLCARVVPTGERMRILGGAQPVAPDRRDEVLAVLAAEDLSPEGVIDVLA